MIFTAAQYIRATLLTRRICNQEMPGNVRVKLRNMGLHDLCNGNFENNTSPLSLGNNYLSSKFHCNDVFRFEVKLVQYNMDALESGFFVNMFRICHYLTR